MRGNNSIHRSHLQRGLTDDLYFGRGIGGEGVHCHDHIDTVLERVLDMTLQVGKPGAQKLQVFIGIFRGKRFAGHHLGPAAVHLEGADGGDQNHHLGDQARVAALDIKELFHADVRAEARLGDHKAILTDELEGDHVGDDRGLTVGDVGKRPRMDSGGCPF